MHEFAESLHLFALAGYVFPDGVDVVEELGESSLDGIRLAGILVGMRIDHYLDAFFLQVNIYLGTRHDRVAIIMDDTSLAAGDVELLALEGLDLGVLVLGLVEHVETHLRCFQNIKWLHDDYVHKSVTHRGLWCNVGIVSIL